MNQALVLLRLIETPQSPLQVQCWCDNGWRSVLLDDQFARAFDADGSEVEADETALELSFEPNARALMLLPGSWVWNGVEEIPRAARRQSSAVGYMVEEQLAEDVEDLHFTCLPIEQDLCSILAISRQKMAVLSAQIARLGWPVTMATPEYQLLAMLNGEASAWLEGESAHIWLASGRGLTVQRALLGTALDSLMLHDSSDGASTDTADTAVPMPSLQLLGAAQEMELASLQSQFGDKLDCIQGAAEKRLLADFHPARLANLLSGEYAVALDQGESRWWRKPAIAVAVCFMAQLIFFVAAGSYYQLRASSADSEARALFTELFPEDKPGADIRRQINGYLNQAAGGSGDFASQLQLLSSIWSAGQEGELQLQSLRFDGNRGEMVLQLRAANLAQLDALVGQLSNSAYKAELLGANELDKGASGRIRLR